LAANRTRLLLAAAVSLLFSAGFSHAGDQPTEKTDSREAKRAFGAIKAPSGEAAPRSIGPYDRGCIAGAQKLPLNGTSWQVMRLSRNRYWGHPLLLATIRKLATEVHRAGGSPGILVGDMAQPIGGPLLGGHASHQTGLDADLWYMPMPTHSLSAEEREQLSSANMVDHKTLTVDKTVWSEAQVKLLQLVASYPEVARIFVHPAIKKALCETAGTDRTWLQKIRPWYQHDDHFHIRLNCPPGSPACVAQAPVPAADDGCDKELDDWFKKLRTVPRKLTKPPLPSKPMLVTDMPEECQSLLHATEQATKINALNSSQ
jgi:penicillin-insensitive murein DD-endopeptidase